MAMYFSDLFSKNFGDYTMLDSVVMTGLSVVVTVGGVLLLAWIGRRWE
jgi:hypothetical protein